MSDTAAFPRVACWSRAWSLAAVLAAGAVLGRTVRGRAWAMLGALVLTPVLLVAEIWNSPQVESVRDRGVAGAGGGRGRRSRRWPALAWLFARRPGRASASLALAALPFRVPVAGGREHGEPARAAVRRDRRGRARVARAAA